MGLAQRKPEISHERFDRKWEMIDGIITFMSPGNMRHGDVIEQINWIFKRHLKGKRSPCKVYAQSIFVNLTKDDKFVPDIAVICNRKILKYDAAHGPPDLIVEVLSHSTSGVDRGRKMEIYGVSGVKEYWIVDAANYSIEVFLQNDGKMQWHNTYSVYAKWEVEMMAEEEKEQRLVYEFTPTVFKDLTINILEIFEDILPEDYYSTN